MKKFYKVIIVGVVQGVDFRKHIKELAIQNQIVGNVRNHNDDTLILLFGGEEPNARNFIDLCRKGNQWTKIEEFRIEELNKKYGFKDFSIVSKSKQNLLVNLRNLFRKSALY